ncbi:M20/M25/M40 family metallo-hydrolase [Pseudonocardiaceae bacterium YIM PH 21723]|nr:M20/M25/M40 family metallo-hydrolase [Pseudonocardiaceae bacterium YIM PH 21723]
MRTSIKVGIGLSAVALVAGATVHTVQFGPVATQVAAPTVAWTDIQPTLQQLQSIADQNGGTRAHGTNGYTASVTYIKGQLDAAQIPTKLVPFTAGGKTANNLIADVPGGDENAVSMFGGHLDSVTAGPGINDNGSGAAAVLAVALAAAKSPTKPKGHLRFAFWGAEELGDLGSAAWVNAQPATELAKIKNYINVDMVGAFDHGNQTWGLYGKKGDALWTGLDGYIKGQGKQTKDVTSEAGDRSDHAAFKRKGIPWVGLVSDTVPACYHQACDKINTVIPDVNTFAANATADLLYKLAG